MFIKIWINTTSDKWVSAVIKLRAASVACDSSYKHTAVIHCTTGHESEVYAFIKLVKFANFYEF